MKVKKRVYQYALLVAGSVLFPVGIALFINPWHLNSGGLIGIAQILSYLSLGNTRLSGVFNFLMNIPLFILAWKNLRGQFVIKTLVSIVIQSVLLSALPVPSSPILEDPLSNVLFGAVICGLGIGLCLQSGGSAGGLDILGMYFSYRKPNFSVGQLSYLVNLFVEAGAIFLFGLPNALYSVLYILVMYFVSDKVHLQNISMYALIITNSQEVKEHLLKDIGRGVTAWHGYGAYTNTKREILLCMINRYEVRDVRKLVRRYDPNAFFLLSYGKILSGNFERRLID